MAWLDASSALRTIVTALHDAARIDAKTSSALVVDVLERQADSARDSRRGRGEQARAQALGRARLMGDGEAWGTQTLLNRKQSLRERLTVLGHRAPWLATAAMLAAAPAMLLVVKHHSPPALSRTSARTYATSIAERASFLLDDGTKVTLAPQTTLRLTDFGKDVRMVALDGEAYFDVARGSAPFVVQTGPVTTRVLGTTFDVRHYANEPRVRVVVTGGKVAVHGARLHQSPIIVNTGSIAYATDSTTTVTDVSDVQNYTTWTNGQLILRGTTVSDMLSTIGAWSGYQFRLADSSLAQVRVNVVLPVDSSRVMLQIIRHLLGVTMTFDGNVVTLHPPQSSHIPPSPKSGGDGSFSTSAEVGR